MGVCLIKDQSRQKLKTSISLLVHKLVPLIADGVEHLTLLPAMLKVDLDHLTCGTWEAQYCRIHANIVSLCFAPFPLAEAGYSPRWCGFLGRY